MQLAVAANRALTGSLDLQNFGQYAPKGNVFPFADTLPPLRLVRSFLRLVNCVLVPILNLQKPLVKSQLGFPKGFYKIGEHSQVSNRRILIEDCKILLDSG